MYPLRHAALSNSPCAALGSSSRRLSQCSFSTNNLSQSCPNPRCVSPLRTSAALGSCAKQQRRGDRCFTRLAAVGGEDVGPSEQGMPDAMTPERARAVLQVSEKASFDDILAQKQQQLSKVGGDLEKAMEVEAAYDLLFMQSMKMRLSGELEVSTGVRYADVPMPPKRTFQQRGGAQQRGASSPQRPSWLPSLPSPDGASRGRGSSNQGMGVEAAMPRDTSAAATQAAVFAGLGVWGIAQALLESPEAQLSETAGLQVALALGYAIYSLKENKGMPLGKAVGISMACLTLGALVGNGIEAWLRVDIVPLGSFASPGVLVSEFIIAGVAAGAVFLI